MAVSLAQLTRVRFIFGATPFGAPFNTGAPKDDPPSKGMSTPPNGRPELRSTLRTNVSFSFYSFFLIIAFYFIPMASPLLLILSGCPIYTSMKQLWLLKTLCTMNDAAANAFDEGLWYLGYVQGLGITVTDPLFRPATYRIILRDFVILWKVLYFLSILYSYFFHVSLNLQLHLLILCFFLFFFGTLWFCVYQIIFLLCEHSLLLLTQLLPSTDSAFKRAALSFNST